MSEKITVNNLGENGLAGYMDLVIENIIGATKATRTYCIGASKISPLVYLDEENIACYYLIQLGGGYIEGELYENYIHVKKNSRVILTTQASNKVYKSVNKIPSLQRTNIIVDEESVLEYRMDSLIMYKDAVYKQSTDIYLKEGSTLIYSDGITSGWSPDGRKYQYSQANLKTDIYMDGELVFTDNMKLIPEECHMQGMGFLEDYKNFGTMLVFDKRMDKKMLKRISDLITEGNMDISFGISELERGGFVIRILGNLTQHIEGAMDVAHNFLRKELLNSNELNLRKY